MNGMLRSLNDLLHKDQHFRHLETANDRARAHVDRLAANVRHVLTKGGKKSQFVCKLRKVAGELLGSENARTEAGSSLYGGNDVNKKCDWRSNKVFRG